ncbi:MAG: hypothetical protein Q9214_007067 [Letrouitia sp. 1 TL-2023]
MALPPDRITVKRRRDEEPVDSLYFPPRKTRRVFIWARVIDPSSDQSDQSLQHQSALKNDQSQQPQAPTVRTTLADDDLVNVHGRPPEPFETDLRKEITEAISNGHQMTSDQEESFQFDTKPLAPPTYEDMRIFHFVRPSTPSDLSSLACHEIQKPAKQTRKDFAVFIENDTSLAVVNRASKYPINIQNSPNQSEIVSNGELRDEGHSPRRRPLATAAERKWRMENWTKPAGGSPAERRNLEATGVSNRSSSKNEQALLELASDLQQYALESTQDTTGTNGINAVQKKRFQPKPPKTRDRRERLPNVAGTDGEDTMNITGTKDDADDFIYETYERLTDPPGARFMAKDPKRMGVLVVAEEDQNAWEMYGVEYPSSDTEWNSEEEDENAEDFYGNDYPEDELDSDDEHDKDVYKHWRDPFDEEELDGSIAWSDDEDEV